MPRAIQELCDLIAALPGIGPRQARRVAQFLLRADAAYRKKLAHAIERAAADVSACRACYRYDETRDGLCAQCADQGRDATILIVVEKDIDIEGIEAAGIYRGQYFVLGSLMPLARQRRSIVAPRVAELLKTLEKRKREGLTEAVLAFATTPEGDYTARELKRKILETFPTLTVSFLGRGLSLGAEIEYADQETLRSAFQGRSEKF